MTFDWYPTLAGVPLIILSFFFLTSWLLPLGIFIGASQIPHYYTHHPAPKWIIALQRFYIFIPPESHASHHSGAFNRNFSVINGWSNFITNQIAKVVFHD